MHVATPPCTLNALPVPRTLSCTQDSFPAPPCTPLHTSCTDSCTPPRTHPCTLKPFCTLPAPSPHPTPTPVSNTHFCTPTLNSAPRIPSMQLSALLPAPQPNPCSPPARLQPRCPHEMQCAAVITQLAAIKVPPQVWRKVPSRSYCSEIWGVETPLGATVPPHGCHCSVPLCPCPLTCQGQL